MESTNLNMSTNNTLNSTTGFASNANIFNLNSEELISAMNKAEALDSSMTIKAKEKLHKKSDRELVRIFLANPTHENFNHVFERFYYGLKRYAYNIVNDWDTAADMAITTFEIAWDKLSTYEPERAEFSTWLYRICRNSCIAFIKDKRRKNIIDKDINDCFDAVFSNDVSINGSSQVSINESNSFNPAYDRNIDEDDVFAESTKEDIIQKICDASIFEIEQMADKKTADILKEKLFNNKKIKTIAQDMHENESNVKNKLYAGKRMLCSILKSKYKELFEMYQEACHDADSQLFAMTY